ncbi:PAS domain-containing sensor histidine kinase [Desulfomicrobium salsuginis]
MTNHADLGDICGIETIKLGFFREVQRKITELKKSNVKIEQRRQETQNILDGIPDVMAVLSMDFMLLSVNKAFFRTYKGVEPYGLHCFQVFKGCTEPCTNCPVTQALECSTQVARNLQTLNWNGEKRQIECTASIMRNAENTPTRIILLQRDVTREKQFQVKYFQAERMATIGILAEGVAHEINNPLTGIGGFAEALTLKLDELREIAALCNKSNVIADFEEYLQTILRECRRCSDIVQNLLTFGHREINFYVPVDLNDVIRNSIKLLHPRLSRLSHDIMALDLALDEAVVLGHPGELMQVVLNLVLNALHAIQNSGRITVSTMLRDNMVILTVSDTGIGIPEDNLPKLFEPFFTTKPPGQGIGVGLSTCYNIIGKHGGYISVESEPGNGATFEVILPHHTD